MAVLYASIFAFAGILMPFMPVWLAAKGLDAREVGLVLASAMVARPIIVPVATRIADRFGWAKGPLVISAWLACMSFFAVALSDGFVAILIAYANSALPQAVVLPLTDAYALRGLAERGLAYGPVRLWGSVTFIAANLGGGFFLQRLGALDIVWVLIAALIATAIAASLQTPVASLRTEERDTTHSGPSLWRSRRFVAVVIAAGLIQASHAVYYGFASLQWAAKGWDGTTIGALWAIGVIAEIALFAASGRFLSRLGPFDLLAIGAAGGVLRWCAMAFDPPTLLVPALQCLHALTFGAAHLGAMHALGHFAVQHRGATAQGDYSAVVATMSAAAMGFSGVLVETFGSHAYLAMGLLAALAGAIIVAAGRDALG
ncbi:MAG: MFS transporter [Xanthobacteraceae bacterium]